MYVVDNLIHAFRFVS